MNKTGKLILVTGLPGVGKTTYSKGLAEKLNAELFVLDNMMNEHYGERHDIELGFREKAVKYDALFDIVNLLVNHETVILDYGFFKKRERDVYRMLAKNLLVESELHYLHADYGVLLERVTKRNKEDNNIHVIDKGILDTLIQKYEVPKSDEFTLLITT